MTDRPRGDVAALVAQVTHLQERNRELQAAATEGRRAREHLQWLLDGEALVAELSAAFIKAPTSRVDDDIRRALERFARHAGAVRASIFRFHDNATRVSNTHEWCADPADSLIEELQDIPAEHLGPSLEGLRKLQNVVIGETADLPAVTDESLASGDGRGFRPHLLVPMHIGDELRGTLVFYGEVGEQREFPQPLVTLLRCMAAVMMNIIERRVADEHRLTLETQIQQAQKLESLGVLAGGIAHDFNNLLVGILGNASLARVVLAPEAPARRYVRDIEVAAQRAAELVSQMLAYSGKGRFLVERIDLKSIVEEISHLLEVSISKKAVLKYEFGENVPTINADATQVRQVVMNLITNASEALGDRSGIISVVTGAMECDCDYLSETYLDDDLAAGVYSYVEVSDTGVGLTDKVRARMFDPFFTTKFAGRGLGLAAVLGIIRAHRGAIKVYSEPNKGTTIKALFPAAGGADKPLAPPQAEDVDWRGEGKILLVDDEETVRAVGRRMLEWLGFEVVTAADGNDALRVFSDGPDDIVCVVLDLMMPHLDGEQCFRELRRLRKDVTVILSSGYNEQEMRARFAGKGLAGFIQKPYQLAELAGKLRAALE